MSRTIDLGQCLLYASDSLLQLQFSAVAHFIHSSNREFIELPIDAFQGLDQTSFWITEAPELEIRLSLGVHTCLKLAFSGVLSSLSEMLCNSKIWSDLGFAIVLKRHGDNQITFGLCRIPTTSNLTKGRTLPNMLRNPPDAHVPPGVPTISLTAINIYADYQYSQGGQNAHKPMHFHIRHMSQPQWLLSSAGCYYPTHLRDSEMVAFSSSPPKPRISSFRDSTLLPDLEMGLPSLQYNSTDNSFGAMLRLIDFGLRRLIISSGARDRQIRVDDNNSLLSLSDLAPAIFNPRYREAVHQRAVSIPIISKSVASMIASSRSPTIQSKLSYLLQQSDHSNEEHALTVLHKESLRLTLHSSLWRIAQQMICKRKESPENQPLFAPESPLPQVYPDVSPGLAHFGEFLSLHSDPLDLDNPNLNNNEQDEMDHLFDYEDLPLKTPSESSFETLDESTPATQNDNTEWLEPCFSEHRDTDMLLFDHSS